MSSEKTVRAVVVRDFKDAGSEKSFAKGDTITVTEGEFGNYEAAGLVSKPDTPHNAATHKAA